MPPPIPSVADRWELQLIHQQTFVRGSRPRLLDDLIEGGLKRSAAMQDCLHALHYVVKWSATGNDEPHPGRAAEPTRESSDSRGCDAVQVKLELEVVSKLHCRPD